MIDNICYRIVLNILYNILRYIFYFFLGQQHLTLLCLRVGGGDSGALVGTVLPDLRQEDLCPQDLDPSPVSIIQYNTVQYTIV